jgi:hypothetical protein
MLFKWLTFTLRISGRTKHTSSWRVMCSNAVDLERKENSRGLIPYFAVLHISWFCVALLPFTMNSGPTFKQTVESCPVIKN